MHITIGTVAAVAVLAGGVAVQVFLSKSKRKWLGFALPIITFIAAIFFALVLPYWNPANSFSKWLPEFALWLLLLNIPTAAFVVTHLLCRYMLKKKRELEKMSVQDLH
jgi:hypothetical protein